MDRYSVLRKIGSGSYGSAYLVCSRHEPQLQYVLKKIPLEAAASGGDEQAEVALLAALDHPFVLRYIDHFIHRQQLCIITDYCEQGDLFTHLQQARRRAAAVPEPQILAWFAQLLLAVKHVHAHSILHRDLKTHNLFLKKSSSTVSKEPFLKLGDFGIARSLAGGMASTMIGSPAYMSPESLTSRQQYDYKSDSWSLGCVLFEMLAGCPAFDAPDMPGLIARVVAGDHQPMPLQASPGLQALVKQLLSPDPALRPTPDQMLALPVLQPAAAAAVALAAQLAAVPPAVLATALPAPAQSGRPECCSCIRQCRSSPDHSSDGTGAAARCAVPAAAPAEAGEGVRQQKVARSRKSLSSGPSFSGQHSTSGGSLDAELAAAMDRLRLIEAQRDAVRQQLLRYQQQDASAASLRWPLPLALAAAAAAADHAGPTGFIAPAAVPCSSSWRGSWNEASDLALNAFNQPQQPDMSSLPQQRPALLQLLPMAGRSSSHSSSSSSSSSVAPLTAAAPGSVRAGAVFSGAAGAAHHQAVAAIEALLQSASGGTGAGNSFVFQDESCCDGVAAGVGSRTRHARPVSLAPSRHASFHNIGSMGGDIAGAPLSSASAPGSACCSARASRHQLLVPAAVDHIPGQGFALPPIAGRRRSRMSLTDSESPAQPGNNAAIAAGPAGCDNGTATEPTTSGSNSSGACLAHNESVRRRREAQREEELQQREAELAEARRSYASDRRAALARAAGVFESAAGSGLPGIAVGSSCAAIGAGASSHHSSLPNDCLSRGSVSRSDLKPILLSGGTSPPTSSAVAAASGSCGSAGKPPLAGRRSGRQLSSQHHSPREADAAAASGAAAESPRDCTVPGAESSITTGHQVVVTVPLLAAGEDDECEIDRQLAGLAASRRAGRRAAAGGGGGGGDAGVMQSISAKSIVALALPGV